MKRFFSRPFLKDRTTLLLRKSTLFAVVLVVLGIDDSFSAADYTITDFPTPTGASVANGINESGQVVGYVAGRREIVASLWTNGRRTDLGLGSGSYAVGINESGQVVGSNGALVFLWRNGAVTSLGQGYANAINSSGQIVGTNSFPDGHAMLWQNGTTTDLGRGYAAAINASGQIVGGSRGEAFQPFGRMLGFPDSHALLWQNGTMTDLGPGYAAAINASGQIVGSSNSHAVLWQNGMMTDLGVGYPSAINNSGQVVGGTNPADFRNGHALLWDNGKMIDLNSFLPLNSGWTLTNATGINDAGQIVGNGYNGAFHAFLLTPRQAPIPEPATIFLFGIGTLGLIGWAWRRSIPGKEQ
jgi:probable HAF family extracellular repeat protein